MSKILYKRTNTGKVQTWQLELKGNKYRTISGQEDGKKVTSAWTECKGKNIGRANETTPEQQAASEVESAYTKKLGRGYSDSTTNIDVDKREMIAPMLAKKLEDYRDKLNFPVYSQPKLDGVRCIVTKDAMYSREGKLFKSCPHILKALAPVFAKYPDLKLDGEMYADKYNNDFNAIISIVKKQKPTAEDIAFAAKNIDYHVYDIYQMPDLPGLIKPSRFDDRCIFLSKILKMIPHVVVVATRKVMKDSDIDMFYENYADAGYEGQIIRLNTPYEYKRSKNLLKHKSWIDDEYKIIDIEEGVGNRAGMAGNVIVQLPSGKTSKASIKGTHDYCRDLLINKKKYIGKMGTVKYFNLTPEGKLRFGTFKGIRDYE